MIHERIGVISDTHGLLRPEAVEALRGCRQIIHAGDVGNASVLDDLRRLAPTTAVRGNVDRGGWARSLPLSETISFGGVTMYVLHDLQELEISLPAHGIAVVISGHSHQPRIEKCGGVLYINPGAAGPRRFRLPVTLAHLEIRLDGEVEARLMHLLT